MIGTFFFSLFNKIPKWFEKWLPGCQKPTRVKKVHREEEAVPVEQGDLALPCEAEQPMSAAGAKVKVGACVLVHVPMCVHVCAHAEAGKVDVGRLSV